MLIKSVLSALGSGVSTELHAQYPIRIEDCEKIRVVNVDLEPDFECSETVGHITEL